MASIAPPGTAGERHSVSPLARLGAIIIALLVTAAGVAPLFTSDEPATAVSAGGQELTAQSGPTAEVAPAASAAAPLPSSADRPAMDGNADAAPLGEQRSPAP